MSNRPKTDSSGQMALSRRELFLGAGMTAGAIAAVGGLTYAPATQAALSRSRQYFATHVLMELDGISAGRVTSAEGGEPVIEPAVATVGFDRTVTGGSLRYEPLTVRLGDMSVAMYDWIAKATQGTATPRAVNVITLNTDFKEIYRLAMQNVRITEITLDKLDSADPNPARFTIRMAPGLSMHQFGKGSGTAITSQKASPILLSNFRLYIQGVETATTRARLVETVGIQIKDGALMPMRLKFSVPFADAGPLFTWMQETLAGKTGARPGELQLLTRDLTKVAASVGFPHLMITRISCPAESSSGGIQHAEVECVPTAVTFNMGELVK